MENITGKFKDVYLPHKALIFYRSLKEENNVYIEAYDTDEKGFLINAHPLSLTESETLGDALHASTELKKNFLKSKGLLPDNVLYIDAGKNGYAIWHTKPQFVPMFFREDLGIADGRVNIPAMIWKAGKSELSVYALLEDTKPTEDTELFYAPFFNIYKDGHVCMGNVDIDIDHNCCLEEFILQWESYFFNSKFSHLLDGYNPVSCNIIQLWQGLVNQSDNFPITELVKNGKKLKTIIK